MDIFELSRDHFWSTPQSNRPTWIGDVHAVLDLWLCIMERINHDRSHIWTLSFTWKEKVKTTGLIEEYIER